MSRVDFQQVAGFERARCVLCSHKAWRVEFPGYYCRVGRHAAFVRDDRRRFFLLRHEFKASHAGHPHFAFFE